MFYSAVPFYPDKKDIIYSQSDPRSYVHKQIINSPPDIFSIETAKASNLKRMDYYPKKLIPYSGNLRMGADPLLGSN